MVRAAKMPPFFLSIKFFIPPLHIRYQCLISPCPIWDPISALRCYLFILLCRSWINRKRKYLTKRWFISRTIATSTMNTRDIVLIIFHDSLDCISLSIRHFNFFLKLSQYPPSSTGIGNALRSQCIYSASDFPEQSVGTKNWQFLQHKSAPL